MNFLKKSGLTNLFIVGLLVFAWIMLGIDDTARVINDAKGNPIYKGSDDKNAVSIAMNVVWGDEHLDAILNILKENDVKITFFVGGKWAQNSSDMLKRMVAEGHEIGSHSYDHEHFEKLSYTQSVEMIKKAADVIYSICGFAPMLFVPPYGEFNDTTLRASRDLGCKTIMWSLDTIDWRGDGVTAILNRVKKNCHNGAIILTHPTADTVEALPEIIATVKQGGREFVTVGEMITE